MPWAVHSGEECEARKTSINSQTIRLRKMLNSMDDNKEIVEFISMIKVLDLNCFQLRLESQ